MRLDGLTVRPDLVVTGGGRIGGGDGLLRVPGVGVQDGVRRVAAPSVAPSDTCVGAPVDAPSVAPSVVGWTGTVAPSGTE